MPSNTYNNLSEEKKQKLIEAAINEFSRVSFSEASINNIINEAGISRGSFYMYFKNKDELFQYILFSHKEKIDSFIKHSLIQNNGDIRTAFHQVFDQITNYIEKNNIAFFKNVFLNLNYQNKCYIVPEKNQIKREHINQFLKYVDLDKINLNDDITLDDIFEMLISITIPSIIHSIIKDLPISEIKEKYYKKIDLLCFGIYRKENEKC